MKSRKDAVNTSIVITPGSFVLKPGIFSLADIFMQHLAKGESFLFFLLEKLLFLENQFVRVRLLFVFQPPFPRREQLRGSASTKSIPCFSTR